MQSTISTATKVLIVDDNRDMLDVLTDCLLRYGYEVSTASSTEEACEFLDREPFDILLSDIRMPIQGGLELVEMLREAKTRIVSVGMSGLDYSEKAKQSGFSGFLLKPFSGEDLAHAIREAQALN